MQKDQNQGQANETGRNPQQGQGVQNETNNRPEVENPQPNRKVEEPITGSDRGGMEAGAGKDQNQPASQTATGSSGNNASESSRGNDAGGSSNKDYQRSNAGFQGGTGSQENEEDRKSVV